MESDGSGPKFQNQSGFVWNWQAPKANVRGSGLNLKSKSNVKGGGGRSVPVEMPRRWSLVPLTLVESGSKKMNLLPDNKKDKNQDSYSANDIRSRGLDFSYKSMEKS
ncbi:hypothetical protein OSB04_016203 [Centaurea solstitialis]|uniref:Uncharacterized protein n=1 Tax=Centaurea solstitialis TaxID=347529 RepID=A0AA38TKH7_9ASTR|nr:hypothetical protein OSB04_016203 [Centaurea solstitialis]